MRLCIGYGISRWVGIGKFVMVNSPASTWDLRSLCRRRTHVRGAASHTRGRQRGAATLQTAYSQCMQDHPPTACNRTWCSPKLLAPQPNRVGIGEFVSLQHWESLLDSEWNARLTCSCFNMMFPVYPTGICLIDPVEFGFCSVWALDGVLIRSSQARDSLFGLRTLTCRG